MLNRGRKTLAQCQCPAFDSVKDTRELEQNTKFQINFIDQTLFAQSFFVSLTNATILQQVLPGAMKYFSDTQI